MFWKKKPIYFYQYKISPAFVINDKKYYYVEYSEKDSTSWRPIGNRYESYPNPDKSILEFENRMRNWRDSAEVDRKFKDETEVRFIS